MKNSLLILFLIASISSASAQRDSLATKHASHKLRYSNSFLVGGLFGRDGAGNTFSVATNQGIRYGRLSTGVGISFDSYAQWRSVPVYGYASFDVFQIKNNALFIFASGGYSKSWFALDTQPGAPTYNSKNGGYFHSMIGYRIQANQYRIYLAAGYKFQQINYSYTSIWWFDPITPAPTTTAEMEVNRITVHVGFGWN